MNRDESGILGWLGRRLNLTEIFSLLTSYGLFYAEVDSQKPLNEALDEALKRPSPSYARGPRVFGLVVVVLLAVEALTGILLSFYYVPSPESAHSSLGTILRDVDFGWLVHQVHFWGSQLLIAVLVLRLVRFFVSRVYRAPRELFWVFGALLFLVALHADLTGRVLPWTSTAYWSGIRSLEIVAAVPIYGDLCAYLLGGGETVISSLTLIRFYVLHVLFLPAAALILIYLHFSAVRRVGPTELTGEARYTGRRLLQRHLANLAILVVVVLGTLVSLAILAPTVYPPAADPFTNVPGVGPPWYLLASFGFLEMTSAYVPQWLAGLVLFLGYMVFLSVPFLVRSSGKSRRPVVVAVAAVAVAVWVFFTLYGARIA